MTQPASIMSVSDLEVGFGTTTVIDGLSFDLRDGEILGLIGPSGSGKSVTLRAIVGLIATRGGTVSFAGTQRGYGNVIEVTHRSGKTTLFAHLSRIDVKRGQKVSQGDFIGAVGSTGQSTGPHLHFEFRDHGVHQDPLKIARESESIPISPALRPTFNAVAQMQRQQLDAASNIQQASAE